MFPDLDSFQLGISMSQLQPLAGNLQAISQGHIESDDPPPWTSRANELDVDLVGPRDHWMVKICIVVPKSVDHWRGTSISTIFHLLGQRHHQNIPPKLRGPKVDVADDLANRRQTPVGSSWIEQDVCALPHDSLFQWKIHELKSHMIGWYWMHGDTLPMFSCLKVLKTYLRTAWVKGWEHVRSCTTYIILHILRSELGCNGSSTLGMSQNQGCMHCSNLNLLWSDPQIEVFFSSSLKGCQGCHPRFWDWDSSSLDISRQKLEASWRGIAVWKAIRPRESCRITVELTSEHCNFWSSLGAGTIPMSPPMRIYRWAMVSFIWWFWW